MHRRSDRCQLPGILTGYSTRRSLIIIYAFRKAGNFDKQQVQGTMAEKHRLLSNNEKMHLITLYTVIV
jgi:hypothetical protein